MQLLYYNNHSIFKHYIALVALLISSSLNASTFGLPQADDIPKQQMVMASSRTQKKEIQQHTETNPMQKAEQPSITVKQEDLAKDQVDTLKRPNNASSGAKKKLSPKEIKNITTQRALNNWVVETATSLFSYSHRHLDRDKMYNQQRCDIETWSRIEKSLFATESSLLSSVALDKIDSKAFLVGPPVFLRIEPKQEGNLVWMKVPIMIVWYTPDKPEKALLDISLAVGKDNESKEFYLSDFIYDSITRPKKPEKDMLMLTG